MKEAALTAGLKSGIAIAEEGIAPTRAGRMEFDLHAEALATAARDLRDAELARIAAGKRYQEALKAFNEFVAPVT